MRPNVLEMWNEPMADPELLQADMLPSASRTESNDKLLSTRLIDDLYRSSSHEAHSKRHRFFTTHSLRYSHCQRVVDQCIFGRTAVVFVLASMYRGKDLVANLVPCC